MREDICTIPVSEVFEENDGCPVCRMKKTVENRILDYIMGAAMMEPDVRTETNKLGFCEDHLRKMMNRRGRLSLALMLQTHSAWLHADVFGGGILNNGVKRAEKAKKALSTCFVCEKIHWGFEHMVDTIYRTYENDGDFRRMFDSQDMFCLEHYAMLASGCAKKNMRSHGRDFIKTLEEKTGNYLKSLENDLGQYCSMYDYRNSGPEADWGNSKDSVERTVAFLTGYKAD